MLQRTKENSCPLALDCVTDTAISCNFKSHQVDNHQCPSCPEKSPGNETLNQAKQIHFDQDWDSQRKCAFKFSISRLPKWAQDKVIATDSITAGPTAFSKVLELKLTFSRPISSSYSLLYFNCLTSYSHPIKWKTCNW